MWPLAASARACSLVARAHAAIAWPYAAVCALSPRASFAREPSSRSISRRAHAQSPTWPAACTMAAHSPLDQRHSGSSASTPSRERARTASHTRRRAAFRSLPPARAGHGERLEAVGRRPSPLRAAGGLASASTTLPRRVGTGTSVSADDEPATSTAVNRAARRAAILWCLPTGKRAEIAPRCSAEI